MTTVGGLLAAGALRLRFHGQVAQLGRIIDRVLITELADPAKLIGGGELVLTAGQCQSGGREQVAFVHQAANSYAAAIGFAVGIKHDFVPRSTLVAARDYDIPVLEIPPQTSFHSIATQVDLPFRSDLSRMIEAQREMFDALLAHGMTGVLTRLTEATGEPSAVLQWPDLVLASAPAGRRLDRAGAARIVPIELPQLRVDLLTSGRTRLAVQLENHAAGLIKLELAKIQAVRAGRRELTGQVIEDIVRSAITTPEAVRRLHAAGVDPTEAHSVLVFSGARVGDLPGATARASVGPYEAVVLHEEQSALDLAHTLADQVGTVGVGGPYRGVHGLRWAFLEAQEAAGRGPGVHQGRVINMPTLLMSNPDLPVREVAHKVLKPLTEFDAERGGELMRTLEAFLSSGGSPQLTAKELFVHRNTVRYRLEQVERLTGLSLSSADTRVHLWLAMRAVA